MCSEDLLTFSVTCAYLSSPCMNTFIFSTASLWHGGNKSVTLNSLTNYIQAVKECIESAFK